MNQKYFPSKVLLFGEYVVLSGGNALAVPFHKFKGEFLFGRTENLPVINDFYNYLSNIDWTNYNAYFDIKKLALDLKSGIEFRSNIPVGYGLGSSGAVSAAVFERYFKLNLHDITNLRSILALIENFFHASSSGIDPLVSYIDKPVKILGGNQIQILEKKNLNFENYNFYLLNSGIARSTSVYVDIYKNKLKNSQFKLNFTDKIIDINNQIINSYLECNEKITFQLFKEISKLEFEFLPEMIISPIHEIWKNFLDSDNISIKLCGAGGGGFYLIMVKKEFCFPEKEFQFKLIKLEY